VSGRVTPVLFEECGAAFFGGIFVVVVASRQKNEPRTFRLRSVTTQASEWDFSDVAPQDSRVPESPKNAF